MKKVKRLVVGSLLVSSLLLGACQKSDKTAVKSTEQTSSVTKESSSTTIERSSSSSEMQSSTVNSESAIVADAQSLLIGKSFVLSPTLYDGEPVNQAMDEQKAPQNLFHDGVANIRFMDEATAHIGLAGSYRPDHDTAYTLTSRTLTVNQHTIPYSIENGLISFESWTTEDQSHTITWSFEPEGEAAENSSENTSDTIVDTKNLTASQLKEWVSAVLDKQFSMGRSSFPYTLTVEDHEGYAYVRVEHSEMQIDSITGFRVNEQGQLEEGDRSNGFPVTYKVMSSKFMDTSEVTVLE